MSGPRSAVLTCVTCSGFIFSDVVVVAAVVPPRHCFATHAHSTLPTIKQLLTF